MFWSFNLCFDILATVLAAFPNIGQIFAQFSGHSGSVSHLMTPVNNDKMSESASSIWQIKATIRLGLYIFLLGLSIFEFVNYNKRCVDTTRSGS
jgi:hypothetical protein